MITQEQGQNLISYPSHYYKKPPNSNPQAEQTGSVQRSIGAWADEVEARSAQADLAATSTTPAPAPPATDDVEMKEARPLEVHIKP